MPHFLKGHWPKAVIGGLVLVNVVLLVLLAIDQRSRVVTAAVVPARLPSPTGPSPTQAHLSPTSAPRSATPDPTESITSSPLPSDTVSSPSSARSSVRRLLAVNSATLGWRAVLGPCPTDPRVEVSRDGGRTWRPTDSGLRSISRMRSYNDAAVFAVGGDQKCESRYAAIGGPGESWGVNQRMLDQTWYRLPSEPDQIHAPGGRLSRPCGDRLRDFAGLGVSGGAALCGDGKLRLTQNGGRRWHDLEQVATGRAVAADEEVYVLAMRSADCDGIGVVLLEPGARQVDSDSVRCAPLSGRRDQQIAVGVRGRVLWLWAGDDVAVSKDRGRNWERP